MTNQDKMLHLTGGDLSIKRARFWEKMSASEARKLWDYRASGYKIETARAAVAELTRRRGFNPRALNADDRKRRQQNARDPFPKSPRVAQFIYRRHERDRSRVTNTGLAARATVCESPQDLNAALSGYPSNYLAKIATERGLLIVRRHENATWDNGGKNHWPSSTSTYYSAHLIDERMDAIAIVERFSRQGDWIGKIAKQLGFAVGQRDAITLTSACVVVRDRSFGGITIKTLQFFGARSFCAVHGSGTTYHADSAREAVHGLRNKLAIAQLGLSGKLPDAATLSREDAYARGYCSSGIDAFCESVDLHQRQQAQVGEIRRHIRQAGKDAIAPFLSELRSLGI